MSDNVIPFNPVMPGGREDIPRDMSFSLRDYFAAAALQGVSKDRENLRAIHADATELGVDACEYLASRMYAIADAMLTERDKG